MSKKLLYNTDWCFHDLLYNAAEAEQAHPYKQ